MHYSWQEFIWESNQLSSSILYSQFLLQTSSTHIRSIKVLQPLENLQVRQWPEEKILPGKKPIEASSTCFLGSSSMREMKKSLRQILEIKLPCGIVMEALLHNSFASPDLLLSLKDWKRMKWRDYWTVSIISYSEYDSFSNSFGSPDSRESLTDRSSFLLASFVSLCAVFL